MQTELITDKHKKVLECDFGVTFDDVRKMDDDEYDALLDKLAMAEVDEDEKVAGDEYTERGKTVSEIIDILCGPYDDDDDEEDDD